MSWTDVFPVLSEAQVSEFQQFATDVEREVLDDWCGVARVVNPRSGKHLVAASLFWKHAHKDDGDLPEITREVMQNAKKLGLVKRFSPWEHYVVPLLEGASALRVLRPEIVFRVYLAADLEFLVEDLVAVGCEVFLMKGSSLRHNPGAMWRFLALEEEGRWVTITDSDRARQVVHDVERTERIMAAGLGLWRVPYIFDSVRSGNSPSSYRPIIACQFGALGGYPVELLMKAFLWHTRRGSMPNQCRIRKPNGKIGKVPIFGTDWPTYGFDEWFLIAAMYPRLALSGVLTFFPINQKESNHWFSLDIEFVTWANPRSEILFFGEPEILKKPKASGTKKAARSRVLERMLAEKARPAVIDFTHRGMQEALTLVVARYQENLDWLRDLPAEVKVVVYNKGGRILGKELLRRIDHLIPLPNQGREADSYLYHVGHFPHGEAGEWTVFCQGDPFPHSPDFFRLLGAAGSWRDVQALTAYYTVDSDAPPRPTRILEDEEWISGLAVRTELCSAHTLDPLNWQDEVWQGFLREYREHHRIPKGWSVAGHFLEACGMTDLAEEAWRATLTRFAYAAIFAVRNNRLSRIPRTCLPRMRELACGHHVHGFVFERLWLHLFGLPFVRLDRASLTASQPEIVEFAGK
jgi:hypothetical protein